MKRIINYIIVTVISFFIVATNPVVAQNANVVAGNNIFTNDSPQALAPRTNTEQMVIDAYKKARNAVVNVNAVATTNAGGVFNFAEAYTKGVGSAVIVDAVNGYIITNYHVVASGKHVTVTLSDGKPYKVKLVGADADSDLALLQLLEIPPEIVAVEFGNSSQLEVGQQVLAIGNPFGLERTLTTGIVSSLGRSIRAENGRLIDDLVQTDAAINPGNSGGPLLDMAGRIIGLNTAIVSRSGENSGIGFSIPINKIKTAIPQLIQHGRILRPKLGVVLANTDFGVVVVEVAAQSPAGRAGIGGMVHYMPGNNGRAGNVYMDIAEADFIVAVNGKRVVTKSDVLDELSKSGKSVQLTIRHGLDRGKLRQVEIIPELG